MDVLGVMGVDALHMATWIGAIAAVFLIAGLQIWLPIMENWRTSWRHAGLVILRSLFAGAVAFVVANVGAVLYILGHATDPRWSVGRDARIDAPELSAGVPLFDGIVNALNGFTHTVANGMNDALAIKNAFLVSGEFLIMTLWGIVAVVGVAVPMLLLGRYLEWWRMRRVDELMVENRELKANVADMRRQLGLAPFTHKNSK